jgi:two-component system cell cycle sensor histidine kinase/response regulator CckA
MGCGTNLQENGVARIEGLSETGPALLRLPSLWPALRSQARTMARRAWLLWVGAAGAGLVALLSGLPPLRLAAATAAATLVLLALAIRGLAAADSAAARRRLAQLTALVGEDAAPCFTTDAAGEVTYRNVAALARFAGRAEVTLPATLGDLFANPGAVLYRLQARAANLGAAREDVVTRHGHLRLSVHRLDEGSFLWRLEEFTDRAASARGAEGASLPLLIANKQGVVLFTNEAARRLLGTRPRRLDRVFTAPVLRSGEAVEVATPDGPVRALLAEITGAGERREIYLLPLPATDPLQVQTDFEHVPAALLRFAADGRLEMANRVARDLLGLAEGAQTALADLFEGPGRPVEEWFADILCERLPGGAEVLRLRRSETEAYFQVTLRRLVERAEPGVLAVLQDATALKTLEAQVVQSQKMQAIGLLAGGIAHDFNNLLTAISGHCDLLLLRHTPVDPDFADLAQIHQNANRAAAVVGQLLAFSRKQTRRPERIDLQDLLSDLVHLLGRLVGERVTLQLAHALDLGPIHADRRQIEQVLVNLVVNARDSMPEGGTIRVSTEAVTLAEPLHRDRATVPAGEYSVIRVADAGVGIAPENLEKIFEPFFTTKRPGEGTGLGLSTVYGIVKQSGGFVFVNSAPGEGTTFQLYFPVHAGEAETFVSVRDRIEETLPKRAPARPGEGVVLLVEDEAPVRAFAARALRMRGFTVIEADCAEAALKTLEDPKLAVDVFLTDVMMPGMDGPTWVREALKERPGVRVIFVSGYAEDCLGQTEGQVPNAVFLSKPFSLNELTATVQAQVH